MYFCISCKKDLMVYMLVKSVLKSVGKNVSRFISLEYGK